VATTTITVGGDYVRQYFEVLHAMIKARGFDWVQLPGRKVRIPRTTNSDAVSLVDHWTAAVIAAGNAASGQSSWSNLAKHWETSAAKLEAMAAFAFKPHAQFADNPRLWVELSKISIGLNAIKATPTTWEYVYDSTSEALNEVPAKIKRVSKEVAKELKVVARAGGGVVGAVATGFGGELSLGVLAIGAGALYLYTRKRK